MPLADLREFLDQPKLTLPIGGREFIVEPCTAATWLTLQKIAADAEAATRGDVEAAARAGRFGDIDVMKMALGATFDQLVENVTGPELQQAGITAWFWQLGQEELAEQFWASGGKAPEATETAPKAPRKATRPTSISTGAASTTKRRASSSGTRSPRKSSKS